MNSSTKPGVDAVASRRLIYVIFVTVAAGVVAGNIVSVARLYEPHLFRDAASSNDLRGAWPATRPYPTPTQGDNDRSRWDTIRALVDHGSYAIGHRDFPASGGFRDSGIVTQDEKLCCSPS